MARPERFELPTNWFEARFSIFIFSINIKPLALTTVPLSLGRK